MHMVIKQALLVLEGVTEAKSVLVTAATVKRGCMDSFVNGTLTDFVTVLGGVATFLSPPRDLVPACAGSCR